MLRAINLPFYTARYIIYPELLDGPGGRGLFHNCLHYGVLEVSLHGRNLRLDHDDGDHLFLRIDPRLGTVGAIPAEASVGDAQAGGHAVLDDTHQQPIPHAMGRTSELPIEQVAHVI